MSEARLLWFDRSGKQLAETAGVDLYGFPRISPDGRKLVVSKLSAASSSGIWIFDLNRNTSSRLTFFAGKDAMPVWSRTTCHRVRRPHRLVKSAGSGQVERFCDHRTTASDVNAQADEILPSWSSDGRYSRRTPSSACKAYTAFDSFRAVYHRRCGRQTPAKTCRKARVHQHANARNCRRWSRVAIFLRRGETESSIPPVFLFHRCRAQTATQEFSESRRNGSWERRPIRLGANHTGQNVRSGFACEYGQA
jgi:hypothetical protein